MKTLFVVQFRTDTRVGDVVLQEEHSSEEAAIEASTRWDTPDDAFLVRLTLNDNDFIVDIAVKDLYRQLHRIKQAWRLVEEFDFDCYKYVKTVGGGQKSGETIFRVRCGEMLRRQDWLDYYGIKYEPTLRERIVDWFQAHFGSTKLA